MNMEIISNSVNTINHSMGQVFYVLDYVWFIILPPLFYYLFKDLWMLHIQDEFFGSADWVLLEIIPPKNIEKSPKLMEALFVGFAGVEKAFNAVELYIKGAFTDYMSLEIVGDSGNVHFYIRTMKKYRHLVEAHLYAQYPNVEMIEVSDYVDNVPRIIPNSQWDIWGSDLEFTKNAAYPIKTYQKFEETVTGKMIDPLAGLIETVGKLGPNQKMWLQWIIRPTSAKWANSEGKAIADKLKGREEVKEGIAERLWQDVVDVFSNLIKALSSPIEFEITQKKEQQPLEFRLSPGERDTLKSLEENLGKVQFYVKSRFIFVGRRENFDRGVGINSFFGAMKQFGDENLNGFKPNADSKTAAFHFLVQPRLNYLQHKILRRYRNRSMDGVKLVMSSEELATVFHLPDMNVLAPALQRVEATRGGAPVNLPTE
jgi:hypothetical protein